MYSKMVQMMLPAKKHPKVLASATGVMDATAEAENGKRGAARKFGRGREKPTAERRNRLKTMGSHKIGTTYHFVRVNT